MVQIGADTFSDEGSHSLWCRSTFLYLRQSSQMQQLDRHQWTWEIVQVITAHYWASVLNGRTSEVVLYQVQGDRVRRHWVLIWR
jgi:hypothetical protein